VEDYLESGIVDDVDGVYSKVFWIILAQAGFEVFWVHTFLSCVAKMPPKMRPSIPNELADRFESDGFLRSRGRELKRLTSWPSPALIGPASMKACSMNSKALEVMAGWWVEKADMPSSISIHPLRAEVWESKTKLFSTK